MTDALSRRDFLRRMAIVAGGLTLGGPARRVFAGRPVDDGSGQRPNFLFIYTDDQQWNAMSCMGHPFLRTPNMDRIAAEGALFSNAFVVCSLCSPSRASFLTGVYPHMHGVIGNSNSDYDYSLPTFATVLQQAGYETAYVGKWHQNPKSGPRPGFDYWLSFSGQGVYNNPQLNENGREFRASGYMTDLLTNYAVRWLARPRQAPFCLVLSHKAVHANFQPAERHEGLYANARMPEPETNKDDLSDKPAWLREALYRGPKLDKFKGLPVPERIPPKPWNPQVPRRLDYFETLQAVDDSVGQVLQALEKTGELDNTVIVNSSDNGFLLGEHRRGDKRVMYEESIRIPLLVRYPPLVRPGTKIDDLALNIDVAPTFIQMAGITPPAGMQGRPLHRLFAKDNSSWRKDFLYEYFKEERHPAVPTMVGIRTQEWSYTHYPQLKGDLDELYDLRNDPIQMHNLVQNPCCAAQLRKIQQRMERLKAEAHYH